MRDGLSLLDQAIAFSGGKIELEHVLEMLGSIDQSFCYQLLDAVCDGDASALMKIIQEMSQYSPNYFEVMSDWLSLLHTIAVAQATLNNEDENISELAKTITPADLQLFYQLSLQAKKDMAFAPHPRQGFEMALLRVIAFRPAKIISASQSQGSSQQQAKEQKKKLAKSDNQIPSSAEICSDKSPVSENSAQSSTQLDKQTTPVVNTDDKTQNLVVEEPAQQLKEINPDTVNDGKLSLNSDLSAAQTLTQEKIKLEQVIQDNWHLSLGQMNLDGNGLQLLLNSLAHFQNGVLVVTLLKAVEHFLTDNLKQSISEKLAKHYQTSTIKIDFVIADELAKTPKQRQMESLRLAMEQGHNNLINDPCVMRLAQGAGVTIDKKSIIFDDKESIIALV
jgi:DNA polymerase-3 subunit gamma/tau